MKAPARARRKSSQGKCRVPPQSVSIYRAHKEVREPQGMCGIAGKKKLCKFIQQFEYFLQVRPAGMRSPDFLRTRLSFPQQVVLRLVSSEASRLSRSNRAKVITLEEIDAAVALVQKKIQSRIAA